MTGALYDRYIPPAATRSIIVLNEIILLLLFVLGDVDDDVLAFGAIVVWVAIVQWWRR